TTTLKTKNDRNLSVVVLPTINEKLVFHSKFLKPRNQPERVALVFAYILRKWRYQISDVFAEAWNSFGHSAFNEKGKFGKFQRSFYLNVNKLITRKSCSEYFLKTIPEDITGMEIIFPSSLDKDVIKKRLATMTEENDKHKRNLYLWLLILPTNLFLAKFGDTAVLFANLFFTYNCFRVNAHYRAMHGVKELEKALRRKKFVNFNSSKELDDLIKAESSEVNKNLKKNNEGDWKLNKVNQDLHDDVVLSIEKKMKVHELSRSYRRARTEYFLYD
ncbi:hypothetical protein HK099_001331, partial [Clydaea vesicula]